MIGDKTDNQVSDSNGIQQAGGNIYGVPPDVHERMMRGALDSLRADLEAKFIESQRADKAELGKLQMQIEVLQIKISEYERRLSDPQYSYEVYINRIAELEQLLTDATVEFGENRINDAEVAMAEGDYSKADAVFAEIQEHEARAVQRAAKGAFGQGLIAEAEVRWVDAAVHYQKAARLDPNYETFVKATEFLYRAGDYAAAIRFGKELVDLASQDYGAADVKTATAMSNLADSYRTAGRFDEAEPIFRQALEIFRNRLGTENPIYAVCVNNLANLLRKTGRFEMAEPLYREAMEITRKSFGVDHRDYAMELNNYAGLLEETDRLEEAEPLYCEALEITRKSFGLKHPNYATCLNNLAGLLGAMGRFEEAEPLLREAVAVLERVLGAEHPNTKTACKNLQGFLAYRDQ